MGDNVLGGQEGEERGIEDRGEMESQDSLRGMGQMGGAGGQVEAGTECADKSGRTVEVQVAVDGICEVDGCSG